MDDFKVGDKVIIHKPTSRSKWLSWLPDMNDFAGQEQIISHVERRTCKIEGSDFWFELAWLENVNEPQKEFGSDMSFEDFL